MKKFRDNKMSDFRTLFITTYTLSSYVIKRAFEDSALYTSKYRLNFRIFQMIFRFTDVF